MQIERCEPQRGMSVLRSLVAAGRRAKASAQTSFKGKDVIVRAFVPNDCSSIEFSLGRDRHADIIRGMLRVQAIYLEEEFFDVPFILSDQCEEFPNYAGEHTDENGIKVQLWTKEPLWA